MTILTKEGGMRKEDAISYLRWVAPLKSGLTDQVLKEKGYYKSFSKHYGSNGVYNVVTCYTEGCIVEDTIVVLNHMIWKKK